MTNKVPYLSLLFVHYSNVLMTNTLLFVEQLYEK